MGERAFIYPTRHAPGFWTLAEGINMRSFFDSLARKHQFNPLVPENWYPLVEDVVISEKVRTEVRSYHNYNTYLGRFHLAPFSRLSGKGVNKHLSKYWPSPWEI
jgi:hypothetical protein